MRHVSLVVAALLWSAGSASADTHWYQGRAGKRRIHVGITLVGGLVYASSETFLKGTLAPETCRICDPPALDTSVRDALRWDNTARAATLSNIDAFVVVPALAIGFAALMPAGDGSADDMLAIAESAVLSGLLDQGVKFLAGRQRPFVHFADPARPGETDDNLSFYSGHSTLTFALATTVGLIAHRRNSRFEPLVWIAGCTLAATAGYLRIAADQHYLTDVVTGAVLGAGIGAVVPRLHRESRELALVPTGRGAAIVGAF